MHPYIDLSPNNTKKELRVYIPSWIVRTTVPKSYFHVDWPVNGGSNGLTMMMPLYDMAEQTEGCHLLYQGFEKDSRVYKYKLGKAAIFGGGLRHSTQPCQPRSQAEKDRPWAFLCFNFGTDRMEYWRTLHSTIACSGKLIVQPDGEVAKPAPCDSYNAALKEGEKVLQNATGDIPTGDQAASGSKDEL